MRFIARLGLLVGVVAVAAAVLASVGGASSAAGKGRSAYAHLMPTAAGEDATGLAYFQKKGDRLSFWIVVYNLDPSSIHAEHIHGPNGSCDPSKSAGVVVPLPDLEADANGVAWASGSLSLAQASIKQVLRKGFYVNVHEKSTADGTGGGITCGELHRSPH